MPRAVTVIVTGLKRIDRKLARLPLRVQKSVARKAMRAGMKVVQAEVKAEAPVESGITRRNVVVRAVKSRKRGRIEIEVRVNPIKGQTIKASKSGKSVFYPATVQYGRKGVAPNPFMTRAYAQSGKTAQDVTLQALLDGVNREAAKS